MRRPETRRTTARRWKGDVGGGFALEHLADEDEVAVFVAVADAVADHAFAERRGELGGEIAHLIGVREEDRSGLADSMTCLSATL